MNEKKEIACWHLGGCGHWARATLAAWKQLLPDCWDSLCCISSKGLELPKKRDRDRQEAVSGQRGEDMASWSERQRILTTIAAVLWWGGSINLVSEPRRFFWSGLLALLHWNENGVNSLAGLVAYLQAEHHKGEALGGLKCVLKLLVNFSCYFSATFT
jgi:hypothetical protein